MYIPKIYNGHNKTFWFFSYEQFLQATFYTFSPTAPVPAYLNGDFSAISANGNCSLCSTYGIQQTALGTPKVQLDALGNQMFANEIYDPTTRGTVPSTGLGYATPFPGNIIPANRFDPLVCEDFKALITSLGVKAQNADLVGNYNGNISGNRYSSHSVD